MRATLKERIVNGILILFFLGLIAGCGWLVIRIMTRWNVEGLG
jgi:hypothetical protein